MPIIRQNMTIVPEAESTELRQIWSGRHWANYQRSWFRYVALF